MRKISVDIFYSPRDKVKAHILGYLQEIKDYDGLQCHNLVFLGSNIPSPDSLPDVYRLFSVQRSKHPVYRECKIVVNVSRKVK